METSSNRKSELLVVNNQVAAAPVHGVRVADAAPAGRVLARKWARSGRGAPQTPSNPDSRRTHDEGEGACRDARRPGGAAIRPWRRAFRSSLSDMSHTSIICPRAQPRACTRLLVPPRGQRHCRQPSATTWSMCLLLN